jgi:hypothetical protein
MAACAVSEEIRGISEEEVIRVIESPGQTHEVRAGRLVYQAKHSAGECTEASLVRVSVDVDAERLEVVTAYRTRKIEKYWR